MEELHVRLQAALDFADMKPIDLARKTGIGKSSISQYLSGIYRAKRTNVYKMAKVLNVNPEWLEGNDVPMERMNLQTAKEGYEKNRLYKAALKSLGWEEKNIVNGKEVDDHEIEEDDDVHTILTNGSTSFEISFSDKHKFENDLTDFAAKCIQDLMVEASKTIVR